MSEPLPERADIRQLRIQAKELLRSLQSGETLDQGTVPGKAKLADAQRLIARKYGFESWPKLVDKVETPVLIEKLKWAIESGDALALDRLLNSKPTLRKHINDPVFPFDSQPILRASQHVRSEKLVPVLLRYGADPNARSRWWAGGFAPLDYAVGETVDLLLENGAKFDVWSAAKQGRVEVLRELLDKDPASVNAPGGDGMTPLHSAANAEVAELLIERGADVEKRDVDHESTPIQYQVNNPEVLRVLLRHGARPDIFTAVVLNDVELVRQLLREDAQMANAHIGADPFVTKKSNGGHIYAYLLGPQKSPYHVAAERGYREALDELLIQVRPARRLVAAALLEDRVAVAEILKEFPNAASDLAPDARAITDAAQAGKTETVRILLEAGLDPMTPGMDSGSALHTACWFGYVEVVRLLIGKVPLDLRDAVHGSPALGWAAHGAQWCRNPKGDYVAVVRALLEAGADPNAPANTGGTSMLDQAGKREDVKEVLREFGAR